MRCGVYRPWVADVKRISLDRKNVSHNTKEVKIKSERKKIKNYTCKSRYKKVALIKFLFLVYHKVNFLINCISTYFERNNYSKNIVCKGRMIDKLIKT